MSSYISFPGVITPLWIKTTIVNIKCNYVEPLDMALTSFGKEASRSSESQAIAKN